MHHLDNYSEILIRQQHAMREAQMEQRRLIQAVQGQRKARFYQPALISLGKRLVQWGTQLQSRQHEEYEAHDIQLAPFNK